MVRGMDGVGFMFPLLEAVEVAADDGDFTQIVGIDAEGRSGSTRMNIDRFRKDPFIMFRGVGVLLAVLLLLSAPASRPGGAVGARGPLPFVHPAATTTPFRAPSTRRPAETPYICS